MTFPRRAWPLVSILALVVGCGSSDPANADIGSSGASGGGGAGSGGTGSGGTGAAGTSMAGAASVAGATNANGGAGMAGASVGGAASASTAGTGGITSHAGASGESAGGGGGQAGSAGAAGSGAGGGSAGPPSSRQTAKPIGGANSAPNGYFEYLPPGYSGTTATPLLVFWHGVGEDGNGGTDLQKVLAHGPPGLIAMDHWDNARPFIVLSPQYTPAGADIVPGSACPSGAVIDAFFTWSVAHYEVDAKRIYLTGLSCGAIGSWDYLAQRQGSAIAAAVVLSGNPGDPTQTGSAWKRAGCTLGTAAIWSLHGDMDPTVPYAPDHDTMTNLLACPAPPRRAATFTDVIGAGHDIWDPIYDLSAGHGDIYAWMLANAK